MTVRFESLVTPRALSLEAALTFKASLVKHVSPARTSKTTGGVLGRSGDDCPSALAKPLLSRPSLRTEFYLFLFQVFNRVGVDGVDSWKPT